MENFSWQCPYCNQHATITKENFKCSENIFNQGNKDGSLSLRHNFITCPNDNCKEYTIEAELCITHEKVNNLGRYYVTANLDKKLGSWQLKPQSSARPFPDYIPQAIREDYQEACLIKDLSPKASATLSRRCLQGMIRDFFFIKHGTLDSEIKAIKNEINAETFDSIDAVRKVGNIGAHMENDINLIIPIEPEEATMLIELIEFLMTEWYINKHERQQKNNALIEMAKTKTDAKKVVKEIT